MPAAFATRLLLLGTFWIGSANFALAQAVPLAVPDDFSGDYVLATQPTDQFYLIVGSLADSSHTTHVSIRTQTSPGPERLQVEKDAPESAWKNQIEAQARLLERQRRERPALDRYPLQSAPPRSKLFHLFTGEHDLRRQRSQLPDGRRRSVRAWTYRSSLRRPK